MNLHQILNLAEKEFIQVWRDKVLVVFLVFGPILQFILLAQTASSGIRHVTIAVVDMDKSKVSRQVIAALDNTPDLDVRYYLEERSSLDRLLDSGTAKLAVLIPPHFAADLSRPGGASLQLLVDGSSYLEGSTALRVAQAAIADFISRGVAGGGLDMGGIELRTMVEYNPGLNVRLHTIPAQFSFIVFQISFLVAALSVARERELGTLEQLQMTPIGQLDLLLGKAVLAAVVGMANFAAVLALSIVYFQVPMRGSLLDLAALTLLFVAANIAMGLIVSVLSGTQQQALLFVFLICVLEVNVSGYLLSVNNMPVALQFLAEFSPLRHYISIVREIMLKGATLDMLWSHAVALLLLAVGSGVVVWGLLKRRAD